MHFGSAPSISMSAANFSELFPITDSSNAPNADITKGLADVTPGRQTPAPGRVVRRQSHRTSRDGNTCAYCGTFGALQKHADRYPHGNGVNGRLDVLLRWLDQTAPDVVWARKHGIRQRLGRVKVHQNRDALAYL
jgi:hypothetical protein